MKKTEYVMVEEWDAKNQSLTETLQQYSQEIGLINTKYIISSHRAEDKNCVVIYGTCDSKQPEGTVHLFLSTTFADDDVPTVLADLGKSGIEHVTLKEESAKKFHSDPLGIVQEIQKNIISPITKEFIAFCKPLFKTVSLSYTKGGTHDLLLWSNDSIDEPTGCITFEESTPEWNFIWFEEDITPLNRNLNLAQKVILNGLKKRAQNRKKVISSLTECAAECFYEESLGQFPRHKQKYPANAYVFENPKKEAAIFLNLAVGILRRHGTKSTIRFKKDPKDFRELLKRVEEINTAAENLYKKQW
ncbi:MAG: hypothetical protein ACERJ1_05335 [Halodesulfovibrio sp.]|uniref:hypothetical protein n=1 Tax=Halodesulfovibrio sp. TaxID=1912772 RepID=UPI00359D2E28